MEMLAASDRAFGFLGDGFSVDDLLIEPDGSDDQEAEEAVSSERCNLHTSSTSSSSAATSDLMLQNPAVELDFHVSISSQTNFMVFGRPSMRKYWMFCQAEDGAELEWLSQFVDDSFFEFPSYGSENNSQSGQSPASPKTNLVTERRIIVPVRARSKRSRKFPSSCTKSPGVIMFETGPTKEEKKRGRKRKHQQQSDTRCSHCGAEKTPQWRAGPMGAKTLCNACGVRFNSGRLLPEYRPACSPTFVSSIHSNSHRKVLELRRKKAEEEERVV